MCARFWKERGGMGCEIKPPQITVSPMNKAHLRYEK
jgi:hypothetical protein